MANTVCKLILIPINTVFVIIGIVLCALGGLAKFKQDWLLKAFNIIPDALMEKISAGWDIPEFLHDAALLILIIGATLFVIGFLGCCGGKTENKCLLSVYMLIVIAILVGQLAAGILIYVKTDDVEREAVMLMQKSIDDTYTNATGGVYVDETGTVRLGTNPQKLAWDSAQVMLKCCGVRNSTSYNGVFTGAYNLTNGETPVSSVSKAIVPLSCCSYITEDDYQIAERNSSTEKKTSEEIGWATQCLEAANPSYTHTEGCYDSLIVMIEDYWVVFAAILGGIVFIELIGFFSACCIVRSDDGKV